MISTFDITGILVLLLAAVLTVAAGLIDHDRTRRVVFTGPVTVPGPGMCGCGAPKCTPPEVPFPGDPEPMLAAPVPDPAPQPGPPAYVREALGGHDSADGFLESEWRKIDGQRLAGQIRDGAL